MAVTLPGLSKLDAVNVIIRALGDPPVAALDTGGTSDAGEAETILDEKVREIQGNGPGLLSGWYQNTVEGEDWELDDDGKLRIRRVDLAVTAIAWVATAKTLTKAAAFTGYALQPGDYVQVTAGTGATTGWYAIASATDDVLTLSTSIGANNADTAIDGIGRYHGDVIAWQPSGYRKYLNYTERDGFVYDLDDATDVLDDDLELDVVYHMIWARLSARLRQYITDEAAMAFELYKKRGVTDMQLLQVAVQKSRLAALQEDGDLARRNVLTTPAALRLKGNRTSYPSYIT